MALITARSALFHMITANNTLVGQHTVVHRFLKGAFGSKPPTNRYYGIWDVQQGLIFGGLTLALKEFALILAMLLALATILCDDLI